MTKNALYVSHKKSKQKLQDGSPKLPEAAVMTEGEIAVNFAEGVETLSIKNESGNVTTFSCDDYYTSKKLGDNFTGSTTVTDAITTLTRAKQDTLVSGTNIKTINNESILGSGNIDIQSGKAIEGGRGITVTSGETTDTVSFNLPISGGSGEYSIIEGRATTASGKYSHAEGDSTTASGYSSHAEGDSTKANGNYSHAEGFSTTASGQYSHVEGAATTASGDSSHAEGFLTTASGKYSHTEGNNTIASNRSEHASGQFNVSSSASTTFGNSGNTLFSVGNGTADNARHNAFEIRQNGDIYLNDGSKLQDNLGNKVDKTTTVNGHALTGNVTVTASDVGLGNVGNFKAVSTVANQGLSDTEKSNARTNLGLGSMATKDSLTESDIPSIHKSKISDFPTSMPASDVSDWAKASTKPSYTASEVGAIPNPITSEIQASGSLAPTSDVAVGVACLFKTNAFMSNSVYTEHLKYKPNLQEAGITVNMPSTSGTMALTSDIPSSLPANGGNSTTVNGHTVLSDVPANAVFTDTNTWRPLGTGATDACAGNDSRLSNARVASNILVSSTTVTQNISFDLSSVVNEMSGIANGCHNMMLTNGTSSDCTVTVPNSYTGYTVHTPDGQQLNLTCPAGGYCEVSVVKIGTALFIRGI